MLRIETRSNVINIFCIFGDVSASIIGFHQCEAKQDTKIILFFQSVYFLYYFTSSILPSCIPPINPSL